MHERFAAHRGSHDRESNERQGQRLQPGKGQGGRTSGDRVLSLPFQDHQKVSPLNIFWAMFWDNVLRLENSYRCCEGCHWNLRGCWQLDIFYGFASSFCWFFLHQMYHHSNTETNLTRFAWRPVNFVPCRLCRNRQSVQFDQSVLLDIFVTPRQPKASSFSHAQTSASAHTQTKMRDRWLLKQCMWRFSWLLFTLRTQWVASAQLRSFNHTPMHSFTPNRLTSMLARFEAVWKGSATQLFVLQSDVKALNSSSHFFMLRSHMKALQSRHLFERYWSHTDISLYFTHQSCFRCWIPR